MQPTDRIEDGLLLAAMLLRRNQALRSPAFHEAIEGLRIHAQQLHEARLQGLADSLNPSLTSGNLSFDLSVTP